jgi:hypothetical protein
VISQSSQTLWRISDVPFSETGMWRVTAGKVELVNRDSGHYKPSDYQLKLFIRYLAPAIDRRPTTDLLDRTAASWCGLKLPRLAHGGGTVRVSTTKHTKHTKKKAKAGESYRTMGSDSTLGKRMAKRSQPG